MKKILLALVVLTGTANASPLIQGSDFATTTSIPPGLIDLSTVTTALAGKQPVGNYLTALTGDGTAAGPGSAAFTLAASNSSQTRLQSLARVDSSLTLTGTSSMTVAGAGSFGGALKMNGNLVTNAADPVSAQDLATKNYVDTNLLNLDYKSPARLGTTAALPSNTYNNGTAGLGAFLLGVSIGQITIDGAVANVNDRVLVKDEADSTHNGIYSVTANSSIVAYKLTRTTDANTPVELSSGVLVVVTSGTVNASGGADPSTFVQTSGVTTIGTDPITYIQISGLGEVTVNASLTKTGNALAVNPSSGTLQGNTFNGVSQLVQTNGSGQLPALSGANLTGTAPGLTAGNVTTNANLTGPVTSVGNATSIPGPVPNGAIDLSTVTSALAGKASLSGATFTGASGITNQAFTATGANGNIVSASSITTTGGLFGNGSAVTNVAPASVNCGDATHSCTITTDASGRFTAITNNTITSSGGGSTSLTTGTWKCTELPSGGTYYWHPVTNNQIWYSILGDTGGSGGAKAAANCAAGAGSGQLTSGSIAFSSNVVAHVGNGGTAGSTAGGDGGVGQNSCLEFSNTGAACGATNLGGFAHAIAGLPGAGNANPAALGGAGSAGGGGGSGSNGQGGDGGELGFAGTAGTGTSPGQPGASISTGTIAIAGIMGITAGKAGLHTNSGGSNCGSGAGGAGFCFPGVRSCDGATGTADGAVGTPATAHSGAGPSGASNQGSTFLGAVGTSGDAMVCAYEP